MGRGEDKKDDKKEEKESFLFMSYVLTRAQKMCYNHIIGKKITKNLPLIG
jgi:Ethanolamine utilization protein EutJ (predicted chaperonin)